MARRLAPTFGRLARQWNSAHGSQVFQLERVAALLDLVAQVSTSAATPQRLAQSLSHALDPLLPHDRFELLLGDAAGSRYYRLGEHAGGAPWSDPSLLLERESLDRFFTTFREDTSQLRLTVLTTLQCNFACGYCIQGDHGDHNRHANKMSPETAARLAEWAEQELDRLTPESLVLTFFGGEPLLNLPVVYYLAERLHEAGVLFAVTSGRPPRGMSMLVEPLALATPIAAFNGGLLASPVLEVLEEHTIPDQLVSPALELLASFGIHSGNQRIGGAYWRPPFVHRALSPRAIFSGLPWPMLRSKISP